MRRKGRAMDLISALGQLYKQRSSVLSDMVAVHVTWG